MYQCLSEQELRDLLNGQLELGDRSTGAPAHLRECAASCAALQERVRGSSSGSEYLKRIRLATQMEVTSAIDPPSAHTSRKRFALDRSRYARFRQQSRHEPPVSLTVHEFLQTLSQSGLLPPAEVTEASAINRRAIQPRGAKLPISINWLISEKKLTRYQADLLVPGPARRPGAGELHHSR